ncbi:MAG: DUF1802 family protein [Verrucomicrobiota bacterium]
MSIGFKEWAVICEALGNGSQSIILRKGGIAEGRDGFCFQHDAFYLFPTWFHEQISKTRLPQETQLPERSEGRIVIRHFVRAEWTQLVTGLDAALALGPFHLWKSEVVEERFRYAEKQGIHVAFLRVYRLSEPWSFPDDPRYGGCRSWVELPEPPPQITLEPVLDDASHAARGREIRKLL